MKRKSIITILIALVMLLTMTSCSGTGSNKSKSASSSNSKTIKIGVVAPLTGDIPTFGKSTQEGVELAVAQVNAAGGINGKKVELAVADDQNNPQAGVAALQKLINNDKVVGVVGSVASKVTLALAPIATQNKVPMVTGMSTNVKVTSLKGNEFAFRACFIDPFQGTVLAKFATDTLKAKTAAMLYDVGNDYCVGLAQNFKKQFEAAGGKVVSDLTYNSGDQDFNAQLTKIKPLNPDVILLPDYYQTVALIAKQARQLGIKATFLGGDGWDSPDLVKIGGDAVNGAYFSNHYSPDDTSPEVVQFLKDFKAKYNETPDALAALGYDAANMLLNAIKNAGSTDGEAIRQALLKTDITSVTGHIKLDADRNPVKAAVMIEVVNGKQKFVTKVNP